MQEAMTARTPNRTSRQKADGGRPFLVVSLLIALLANGCDHWKRDIQLREKAQAALRASNPEEAAELFFRAYEVNPRGPGAARNLYDYARTEDLELQRHLFAAEVYQRLVTSFPSDPLAPEALERLAALYSDQLVNYQMAIDTLARIADDYPGFGRADHAILQIAREHEKAGNRDQATLKYEQFIRQRRKSPLIPRAHYLLASIQSLQGRYIEALQNLESAEEIILSNPSAAQYEPAEFLDLIRIEKARALESLGEKDRALSAYRSVSVGYSSYRIIRSRIEQLDQKTPNVP